MTLVNKESQNQTVGDKGVGIQAKGDVTINGLSYPEVKEIFTDLLELNFPKFSSKIAIDLANNNAEKFIELLFKKFQEYKDKVDIQKFQDPDILVDLNVAVTGAARKGEAANIDLLSQLVTERVNVNSNDMTSLMISEAIKVVPNLNKNQLEFLSLLYFMKNTLSLSDSPLKLLELKFKLIHDNLTSLDLIKPTEKEILTFYSLTYFNENKWANETLDKFNNHYKCFIDIPNKDFLEYIKLNTVLISNIFKLWIKHNYEDYNLSPLGNIIAITHLNLTIPHIKLSPIIQY